MLNISKPEQVDVYFMEYTSDTANLEPQRSEKDLHLPVVRINQISDFENASLDYSYAVSLAVGKKLAELAKDYSNIGIDLSNIDYYTSDVESLLLDYMNKHDIIIHIIDPSEATLKRRSLQSLLSSYNNLKNYYWLDNN